MLRRTVLAGICFALSSQVFAAEVCRDAFKAYEGESVAAAKKGKLETLLTECAAALKASDKTLRNRGAPLLKACDSSHLGADDKQACKVDAYRYLLWFQY